MKPYLRVLFNKLKLSWIRAFNCSSFNAKGIQLIGWNTKIHVEKTSKIYFGEKISSDGRLTIIVGDEAELSIGNQVYFNERAMISCHKSIQIGDHCLFGPNVTIIDNDHKYSADKGVSTDISSASITIGNNCWVGANTVILKGTTIGDNCVIGANCTVKGNIPESSKVTQNRELKIEPIR